MVTEILRIDKHQKLSDPTDRGIFYSKEMYMVSQRSHEGPYVSDIHFWLGKDASEYVPEFASSEAFALGDGEGHRPVLHRELQGYESDKFLSYFKPCIILLDGDVASGLKLESERRLYICRGTRVAKLEQVSLDKSSLNHGDVFILHTEQNIYQFNGKDSTIQERAKALEVTKFLNENYHEGKGNIDIINDGKLQAESGSSGFWGYLGSFHHPISKKVASEEVVLKTTTATLYSIEKNKQKKLKGEPSKATLKNNKCYLLDRGAEVFIWVGRQTEAEGKEAARQAFMGHIRRAEKQTSTCITCVFQGHETHSFKTNFVSAWPVTSSGEDASLKQGDGVKDLGKGVLPLPEGGKVEVWLISDGAKRLMTKNNNVKFDSGHCYIVLYTYNSGDKKKDYLCWWIGKHSIEDDRKMAAKLANTMYTLLKRRPVLGRIFEDKEPPQFRAIFQSMGGLSAGYTAGSVALKISGTSVQNNEAVQVDASAVALKRDEEGNEEPSTSRKLCQEVVRDPPRLFSIADLTGKFEVKEVYNFDQDDLLTEDILILDTNAEIFVWVGQYVASRQKQEAFQIGEKIAVSRDRVPLYVITEGNEPCFFKNYFSWDSTKATLEGNSFQKKALMLFGAGIAAEIAETEGDNDAEEEDNDTEDEDNLLSVIARAITDGNMEKLNFEVGDKRCIAQARKVLKRVSCENKDKTKQLLCRAFEQLTVHLELNDRGLELDIDADQSSALLSQPQSQRLPRAAHRLKAEYIRLREGTIDDKAAAREWLTDRLVTESSGWTLDVAGSDEHVSESIANKNSWYRIIWAKQVAVGEVAVESKTDITGDIGILLAKRHWGKGIGTVALKMALTEAFARFPLMSRIEAMVRIDNIPSQKLLSKVGFMFEGCRRKCFDYHGDTCDMLIYSYLK